jgi:protoporphyrinogen/coproporphyrinogen III oxidase
MNKKVVILGAGISGLALGWFLRKRFGSEIDLTILEKSSRFGGWIRSEVCEGFLCEEWPRSCRTSGTGAGTLRLIEALGLQHEVISAAPEAQRRFLYLDGKLCSIPKTAAEFLLSSFRGKIISALLKEWVKPASEGVDESVYEFMTRRLGTEVTEAFIDPLVSGIYAGDTRRLSIRSCFPEAYRMEKEEGSLVKGMLKRIFVKKKRAAESFFVEGMQKVPIFSFRKGMETLATALANNLSDCLKLGCKAEKLSFQDNAIKITTAGHGSIEANYVFLALPSEAAAGLLLSISGALAKQMRHFASVSVGVVNMGWKKAVLKEKGFGYLIPSIAQEDVLGVVWDSCAFPEQKRFPEETRLTVMLGGAHRSDLLEGGCSNIEAVAGNALKKHLDIWEAPDMIRSTIVRNAIPQYDVGHAERLCQIEQDLKEISKGRIRLIGSAWHGVSVNDCIATAQRTAESLMNFDL